MENIFYFASIRNEDNIIELIHSRRKETSKCFSIIRLSN